MRDRRRDEHEQFLFNAWQEERRTVLVKCVAGDETNSSCSMRDRRIDEQFLLNAWQEMRRTVLVQCVTGGETNSSRSMRDRR